MSHFKIKPLAIALFTITTTPAIANTTNSESQNVNQLSTIVVSAAGYEQKIKDAPASITVLDQNDFKTKRITSLADALKGVEGVDISPSAGKTGTLNIRMRGMPAEYTLILIDGKRQNSVGSITPNGFAESNNNFIPPISAIERIEVIRGPMSTLYGSDAMGGVINIITKKVSSEWTGAVTLNGTLLPNSSNFGNQYSAEVFASGPLIPDLVGVQLRGRKSERQQSYITVPNSETGTETLAQGNSPTKSDIETFGGRLTFTPHSDHTLALDFENTQQWFDNSRGQLGTYLDSNGEPLKPNATQGYASSQEYERTKGYISHEWDSEFGRLETSISQVETETIGRLLPSGMLNATERTNFFNRNLKSEDTYLDTKFTTQKIANHNVTIGGQWWKSSVQDGIRRANPELSFDQYGLFIEDTWSILPNLNLTLGGRFDDHSAFGDFFTPRAYVVWNVNDLWTAKGGYAEGYKVPRLEQLTQGLSNVASQGRAPVLGSESLKPETSESTELGLYFDNQNGFNANVTFFQNKTKDKITTSGANYSLVYLQGDTQKLINDGTYVPGVSYNGRPIEFDCTGNTTACNEKFKEWGIDWNTAGNRNLTLARPYNADEAKSHGIEVGAGYQINEQLKLSGNYTWTKGELTDALGKTIDDVDNAEHVANLLFNYQPTDNSSIWVRGEYRSSQLREEGNVKNALGDFKGYTQWHLGTNYSLNDNVDFGLALYNIFDKDFVDYRYVSLEDTYYNSYTNTQEGRRVQLSTTFKF